MNQPRPFEEFARHYDRFMLRYVDYRAWVDYVERIFHKYKIKPKTILDLACGTGIPTVILARRGYSVAGVDRSPQMLEMLKGKSLGLPITTLQAEMTDFRLDTPVDAAISLYDSVNYLLTEEDLVRCFTCVRRALSPGGILIFDMNTVYSLSVFWGNRVSPRNVDGIASLWQNTFDEQTRISTLHLTFWEEQKDGGEPVRYEEVHRERAYTRAEVARSLKQAGFAEARFFSHGTFFPVMPLTTRMMVVAL